MTLNPSICSYQCTARSRSATVAVAWCGLSPRGFCADCATALNGTAREQTLKKSVTVRIRAEILAPLPPADTAENPMATGLVTGCKKRENTPVSLSDGTVPIDRS